MSKERMTNCKACGQEVAKGAKACPHCGKDQRNFFGKHKILSVLLFLIALGIIGGAFSGEDDPKPAADTTPAASQEDDTATSPETSKADNAPLVFGINEPAEYQDIIVTLNSLQESNGSEYNKPSEGNVFLLAEFTFENNSSTDLNISSLLSFDAYVDGYTTSIDLSATLEKGNKQQLDGTVAPGKKMNGIVGFQVPANWQEFETRVAIDVWSSQDIVFLVNK